MIADTQMSWRTTNIMSLHVRGQDSIPAQIILKVNWSMNMPWSWQKYMEDACSKWWVPDVPPSFQLLQMIIKTTITCKFEVSEVSSVWPKKWDQLQHCWMLPKSLLVLYWVLYWVSIYSNIIIMMYISESQMHEAERFEWLTKEHLCVLVYLVRMQLKQNTIQYSLELCPLNLKRRIWLCICCFSCISVA